MINGKFLALAPVMITFYFHSYWILCFLYTIYYRFYFSCYSYFLIFYDNISLILLYENSWIWVKWFLKLFLFTSMIKTTYTHILCHTSRILSHFISTLTLSILSFPFLFAFLQAHAASAVLNFSENCTPDILTHYLDGIVGKLLILLQVQHENICTCVQIS